MGVLLGSVESGGGGVQDCWLHSAIHHEPSAAQASTPTLLSTPPDYQNEAATTSTQNCTLDLHLASPCIQDGCPCVPYRAALSLIVPIF